MYRSHERLHVVVGLQQVHVVYERLVARPRFVNNHAGPIVLLGPDLLVVGPHVCFVSSRSPNARNTRGPAAWLLVHTTRCQDVLQVPRPLGTRTVPQGRRLGPKWAWNTWNMWNTDALSATCRGVRTERLETVRKHTVKRVLIPAVRSMIRRGKIRNADVSLLSRPVGLLRRRYVRAWACGRRRNARWLHWLGLGGLGTTATPNRYLRRQRRRARSPFRLGRRLGRRRAPSPFRQRPGAPSPGYEQPGVQLVFLLGFHPSYIFKDFGDLVLPEPLYELIPLGLGNLLGDCQILHSFCC